MEILKSNELPITVNPEILGGTPVFRGTRVPIKTLFDYIRWGYSLEEIFDCFPSVSRELAVLILTKAEHSILHKVS